MREGAYLRGGLNREITVTSSFISIIAMILSTLIG